MNLPVGARITYSRRSDSGEDAKKSEKEKTAIEWAFGESGKKTSSLSFLISSAFPPPLRHT